MRSLVIALVALFAFSILPSGAEAQSLHTIEGTVCLEEERYYIMAPGDDGPYCGRGIPGATVSAALATAPDVPVQTATTGEKGAFAFRDLAEGQYVVRVTRTGFAPAEQQVAVPSPSITFFPAPQEVAQQGSVASVDGTPLQARVWTCCGTVAETESDPSGAFTLRVDAGWHTLSAEADHHMPGAVESFIDGTGSVELVLEPTPPPEAYVTGFVRDQEGRPVAGATVEAWSHSTEPRPMPIDAGPSGTDSSDPAGADPPTDGQSVPERRVASYGGANRTTTASDGTYRIGVYAGHVSISVYKDGHASAWTSVDVTAGASVQHDIQLARYPEKTARIEGQVTGPDARFLSISVESPLLGIHECSTSPAGQGGATGAGSAGSTGMEDKAIEIYPYPGPECAITLDADGTFSGSVTPGYTILRVYHNDWMACDGRSSDCGPRYLPFVRTLDLPADETTRLDIALRARPVPDSVVSGYLVDDATDTAIPGGQVSFSRADGGGYGWATTDQDGSYRMRLAAGTYEVAAWADGYLAWAGMVEIDGEESFDIPMRAGQAANYYPTPMAAKGAETADAPASLAARTAGADEDAAGDAGTSDFEDLGGGLGPYDASRRNAEDTQGSDAPTAFALVALGLIATVALARRK